MVVLSIFRALESGKQTAAAAGSHCDLYNRVNIKLFILAHTA